MPEVRMNTGWLGGDVEIRFQGTVTGKVEIREPGQEWEPIEKVEGSVSGCSPEPLRVRENRAATVTKKLPGQIRIMDYDAAGNLVGERHVPPRKRP